MSKSARIKNARNNGNARAKNSPKKNAPRKNALTQREVPWGSIAFFGVIGLVAVIAIGYAFMQTRTSSADSVSISGLVTKDGLSSDHVAGTVAYDTDPPMGGNHNPVWQNCDGRVYDAPLQNENAVHSLEHGAVWITYRPGLAPDQLEVLRSKVTGTDYTLLSPYPSQDSPVTLTAWGRQLKLQNATDPRVDAFLRAFVKGPQTPEPGAACDGAKDTA
ncbi:DUF3105 domain-containing protein [Actinomadura madurae]|uniref:DUF3105 domain-containing protein n=1 Tax=Actinomadura madurae TaxID=1993 RepID=UPI0020268C20|nr:DUF3105 domain-containing protein [Actinomadura madurae]MCP9956032.1 DUF3105 domain-containing protein [Actinomadura madurae]MCP9985289.1 DUF3105 domain-containing protein [Actinomadura madurae]MCQ0012287.1 DUF3105 domain-containing protein [Actinomadura madurae]MCQ0012343.1 DUF3105 domain-containing protein [Actinomadura madurae]MCQ0021420.1 DUF3105 domain-containing protein [Actinomadura madurae]